MNSKFQEVNTYTSIYTNRGYYTANYWREDLESPNQHLVIRQPFRGQARWEPYSAEAATSYRAIVLKMAQVLANVVQILNIIGGMQCQLKTKEECLQTAILISYCMEFMDQLFAYGPIYVNTNFRKYPVSATSRIYSRSLESISFQQHLYTIDVWTGSSVVSWR